MVIHVITLLKQLSDINYLIKTLFIRFPLLNISIICELKLRFFFKSGDILNVLTPITPGIRGDQYQVMLISDYTSILCHESALFNIT